MYIKSQPNEPVWLMSRIFAVLFKSVLKERKLSRNTIQVICNPSAVTIPGEHEHLLENCEVSPSYKLSLLSAMLVGICPRGTGIQTRAGWSAADPQRVFCRLALHSDAGFNLSKSRTFSTVQTAWPTPGRVFQSAIRLITRDQQRSYM